MYTTKPRLLRLIAAMALVSATLFSGQGVPRTSASSACPNSIAAPSVSTFEGGDGNTKVNTAGCTDWETPNLPNFTFATDLTSSTSDNIFGQGTKEDSTSPTFVLQKADPKNDLSRFYVANEVGSDNHDYLYLAFERMANNGNANEDFEINHNFVGSTKGSCTAGYTAQDGLCTPLNRTDGDVLIQYNFAGSGTPTLTLWRWAANPTSSYLVGGCLVSSDTAPCWSDMKSLDSSEEVAAVNSSTFTDNTLPASTSVGIGGFGEAAIDLTKAGVFPSGTCQAFGGAWVKGRSSSSPSAELKDFISPAHVNISNCGTITIHKVTENGDGSFGYTTTGGLSPATFSLSNGGTQTYNAVPMGSYNVTESTLPGWTLKSLVCTATGSGTSTSTSGATANITMGAGGTVDCTYTNHTNVSPSISTTLSATTANIGDPVHDSATLTGATSNAGGTVTYTVYTDSACTQNPQSAGTKTVTNGVVPDSDAVTFNTAGLYFWQAVYSGDANNNPATSACTEEQLVVNPNSPTMSTAQNVLPNDSATISGATSNASGTITFSLFSPSDATCSGTPAYTQQVTVNGNGTYNTSNTTVVASTPGTWNWKVDYVSGDANNVGTTSKCGVENFTIKNV